MKLTKRILAVVITLALALTLALPATATVNWDEFRIATETQDMKIQRGESFTLSVEVIIPDGVEVEYQWVHGVSSNSPIIENATSPNLRLSPNDTNYPSEFWSRSARSDYYCKITAFEKDNENNVISSKTLRSKPTNVIVEDHTFLGKLYSVTVEPFAFAAANTGYWLSLTMFFTLPLSPLFFLYFLAVGFINGFRGLF